jgi:hypothetical protein
VHTASTCLQLCENDTKYESCSAQEIERDLQAGNLDRIMVRDEHGADVSLADMHAQSGLQGSATAEGEWDEDEDEDEDEGDEQEYEDAAAVEEGKETSTSESLPAVDAWGAHELKEDDELSSPAATAFSREPSMQPGRGDEQQPPHAQGRPAGPGASRRHEPEVMPPPPGAARPKQAPERVELRDAVFSDASMPAGAAARMAAGLGGGAKTGGPVRLPQEEVQAQARAAGKPFMDSLARNVGQAADDDKDSTPEAAGHEPAKGMQLGSAQAGPYPDGELSGAQSLIDDIAAGREVPSVSTAASADPPPQPRAAPLASADARSSSSSTERATPSSSAAASSSPPSSSSNGAAGPHSPAAAAGATGTGTVQFIRSSQVQAQLLGHPHKSWFLSTPADSCRALVPARCTQNDVLVALLAMPR